MTFHKPGLWGDLTLLEIAVQDYLDSHLEQTPHLCDQLHQTLVIIDDIRQIMAERP